MNLHTEVPHPHRATTAAADHSTRDADALLTRKQAAAALTGAGFPISHRTLESKAVRGGGPPFMKFGPRVVYRWGDVLAWAQSRLTAPRSSTSEVKGKA